MRHWTDEKFRDAGWVWVLRDPESGLALACTVEADDAGAWFKEKRGEVIALAHL